MKLTKGKKIALISFAVFLAFMAVCTVAAKGIYASGLPRVSTMKPYSGSLTHVITVNATVMQGQEYGVYVENGLRVDTVAVSGGDVFQAGQELFRIETGDLAELIRQRRLEIAKLEVEMAAAVKDADSSRQSRKRDVDRAREDYDRKAVLADEQILVCQQAYDAAQKALALYDRYLEDSAQWEENGGGQPSGTATPPPEGDGDASGTAPPPPEGEGDASGTATPPPEGEGDASGTATPPPEGEGDATGTATPPPEGEGDATGTATPPPEGEGDATGTATPPPEGEGDAAGTATPPPEGEGDAAGTATPPPEGEGDASGISETAGSTGNPDSEPDGTDVSVERGRLHEVGSEGMDPEKHYNRQEKRLQLEQDVIRAAQALEEAVRQKEDTLRDAARVLEDANAALDAANSAVNTLALEIDYQKESLQNMEALLEADGWVYAEISGRVIRCSLEVGSRTQDGASIVYAKDDGERILSAVFDESQSRHVAVGTQFEMKAAMPDGSRATGIALLDYLEKREDGTGLGRLSYDLQGMAIGQTAELTLRVQTDSYSACISRNCLFQEGEDNYYIYIAEEQEGILGTEWKVRKVRVNISDQNDTAAAVQSAEINGDTRIVSGTDKPLEDGDTVRVLQ